MRPARRGRPECRARHDLGAPRRPRRGPRLRLGGRRQDGGRQPLRLLCSPSASGDAAQRAPAVAVDPPGVAGEVAADHELDRQRVAPDPDGHVGVGDREHVVGRDARGLLEGVRRDGVEHLPFERDRLPEHVVERRQPVGGDQHQPAVAEVVGVADLALVAGAQAQVRAGQRRRQHRHGVRGAVDPRSTSSSGSSVSTRWPSSAASRASSRSVARRPARCIPCDTVVKSKNRLSLRSS